MTLCHIIGRPVRSGDGEALGVVTDIIFMPAAPGQPRWAIGGGAEQVAALPDARGGFLALAVIEVGMFLGLARHRVALQVVEMDWDAAGDGVVVPGPAACLRARLPAMAAR